MKKLLILTLCCTFILAESIAQEKEKEYKWGVGVQVNTVDKIPFSGAYSDGLFWEQGESIDKSYSVGVHIERNIKDDIWVLLKTDYTNRNTSAISKPIDPLFISFGYTENELSVRQTNLRIGLRLIWKSSISDRIKGFAGLSIPINLYGEVKTLTNTKNYNKNGDLTFAADVSSVIPKGDSFGAGTFFGFNIRIVNRLYLGPEVSFAFSYLRLGGKIEDTIIETYPGSSVTTISSQESYRGWVARNLNSIGITYMF